MSNSDRLKTPENIIGEASCLRVQTMNVAQSPTPDRIAAARATLARIEGIIDLCERESASNEASINIFRKSVKEVADLLGRPEWGQGIIFHQMVEALQKKFDKDESEYVIEKLIEAYEAVLKLDLRHRDGWSPAMYKILITLAGYNPLDLHQISNLTGGTEGSVKSSMSHMRSRGIEIRFEEGFYTLVKQTPPDQTS